MSRTKNQILMLIVMLSLFVTANAAPDDSYNWSAPPVLVSPSNGATGVIPLIQLDWTGSFGNAAIEIYQCGSGQAAADEINLNAYQKVIGPKIISSIPNDLSGVTYNPLTNSLFMVTNKNSKIYETDLNGNITRTINLIGYEDPEDIVHLYGTKYAVAEEKQGKVIIIDINTSTSTINLSAAPYTQLPGTWSSSDGVEGVSYDPATNTMYGAVEVPMRLHKFPLSSSNSSPSNTSGACNLQLNSFNITDVAAIHHLGLTSGLSELNVGDHLLILSEESKVVVETDNNCFQYGRLNLPSSAIQPEGITMDNDGNIYVVGEPNQFYKYTNPNLDLNPSNLGTLVHNATSSNGTYTIPDNILQAGVEYCWRVGVNGEWSDTWSFTPGDIPDDPNVPVTVISKITSGNDDVEQASNGSMYLNSSDLELVQENSTQTIGLKFRNLGIPQGANILSAYVQFSVDESTSAATILTIQGDDNNSAANFSSSNFNVSNRPKTSQSVQWQVPAWNTVGQRGSNQKTPDIKSVIQEIVNRNGFNTVSSLGIIITGTGKRVAEAYEGGASGAAELTIIYNMASPSCPAAGTVCNDNDTSTYNDVEDGDCNCEGTPCLTAGTVCNDGDANTENDVEDGQCNCAGTEIVCEPVGTPCDDNNADTFDDQWDGNCVCIGKIIDGFTFETRIATGNDDVEENGRNGNMYLNSTDLELVYDRSYTGNQVIGLRFTGVWLPPGAQIKRAYVQFTTDEARNLSGNMIIHADASGNSPAFTTTKYNLSSRTQTQAYKVWTPAAWNTVGAAGAAERTSNIAPVIQEIVNRSDWDGVGRAITIIIEGAGRRIAESYDGSPAGAPLLRIEYENNGQNIVQEEDDTQTEPEENEVEQRKDESIIQQVSLYPNPANYEVNVNIEIDQNTTINTGQITLFDMTGKMLKQVPFDPQIEHNIELDIESLASGTYVVHIQIGEYTATRKLLKK